MNNNAIGTVSPLYNALITAYEIEEKRDRFFTCYNLVEASNYEEIHLAISMLKEAHSYSDSDIENILVDSFKSFFNALKVLLAGKSTQRAAFLLDILEEGRERKRP